MGHAEHNRSSFIDTEYRSPFKVEQWTPADVDAIYALEETSWAPWLRKPTGAIRYIAEHFPHTQFLARDPSSRAIFATLTTNRITWGGNPDLLKSWDVLADGPVSESNYAHTYESDGNTLCLMSANADPNHRGIASQLLTRVRDEVAPALGITNIVSFFRPSEYGKHKLEAINAGEEPLDFKTYCEQEREDGLPKDPWLRSVRRLGIEFKRPELESMRVRVSIGQFEDYKRTHQPYGEWKKHNGLWECGETGSWRIIKYASGKPVEAEYIEPNYLGIMKLPAR